MRTSRQKWKVWIHGVILMGLALVNGLQVVGARGYFSSSSEVAAARRALCSNPVSQENFWAALTIERLGMALRDCTFAVLHDLDSVQAVAQVEPPVRRVNVPDLRGQEFTPAVFWLGKVSPVDNYADVRIYHYGQSLGVVVHIIDRWLRYDTAPSPPELTQWDSVSLYLDATGSMSSAPGEGSFRFDTQLVWWEPQENYQASYRGDGTGWQLTEIPFTTETGWRGEGVPNDNLEDKGWTASFSIPFESLGLESAPLPGTVWRLGVAVHDRDDISTPTSVDTVWPEELEANLPYTWGQAHFGIPEYENLAVTPGDTMLIRQGLNGATVTDGHVGGHTTCGEDLDHWNEWGETNYAGYEQINIQNQWDISDWPCFSKFYINFPLDSLPPGQEIYSATLTMYMFGNAGGGVWGEAPDSYIQVLRVDPEWDESTLTWNNAPLARENVSGTWVYPMTSAEWVRYHWDVSRAVAAAYNAGEPLSLALYSADGDYHTGKYFISSDTGDFNAVYRPTLRVRFTNACGPLGNVCKTIFLPVVAR